MKKISIFLILAFITTIFTKCVKDEMPNSAPVIEVPVLSVTAPTADDNVTVSVKITDDHSVESVKLVYFLNNGDATEIAMNAESNDIYKAVIPKQTNLTVVSFYIEATDDDSKSATYPNDAPNTKLSYTVGADAVLIFVNEVICKDDVEPYFTDEEGGGTDWIELYNGGLNPIDIGGMYITDDPSEPAADWQQIPATDAAVTTIQPGGYLVLIVGAKDASGVRLTTQILDGKIFIEMGLKASGTDNVTLFGTDQATMLDQSGDILNELEDEKSYGRSTDGGATWQQFDNPTPGASNE